MATLPLETSINDLPPEIILKMFNDFDDNTLIQQLSVNKMFRSNALEILKKRLDNLSIDNLIILNNIPEFRIEINKYYAKCLLLLNFKRIKEIYENIPNQMVKDTIEARISPLYIEVITPLPYLPKPLRPSVINKSVPIKIDIIRAHYLVQTFKEYVDQNDSPEFIRDNKKNIVSLVINRINNRDRKQSEVIIQTVSGYRNLFIQLVDKISVNRFEFNMIFQVLFYNILDNTYSYEEMKILIKPVLQAGLFGEEIEVYTI